MFSFLFAVLSYSFISSLRSSAMSSLPQNMMYLLISLVLVRNYKWLNSETFWYQLLCDICHRCIQFMKESVKDAAVAIYKQATPAHFLYKRCAWNDILETAALQFSTPDQCDLCFTTLIIHRTGAYRKVKSMRVSKLCLHRIGLGKVIADSLLRLNICIVVFCKSCDKTSSVLKPGH